MDLDTNWLEVGFGLSYLTIVQSAGISVKQPSTPRAGMARTGRAVPETS